MPNEFESLYPSFEEVRALQEQYAGASGNSQLSQEEKKKLYDSQKYLDVRGEGVYKDDLKDGIWTEWYESKFRDLEDLEILRYKALLGDVNKMIDEEPEFINDEDEDEVDFENRWEFTSDDFLNFLLIKKRLREFNGCLKIVSNYVAGKKEYLSIGYGDNEETRFKCHYKSDSRDGHFTEWYENGQIKLECNYKDDHLDGHLMQWFDDGEKMLESVFEDGVRIGEPVIYNESRMIQRKGPIRVRKGPSTF
jgi:antitoxin component YwqK of YwqJK toxin-antitoxin module